MADPSDSASGSNSVDSQILPSLFEGKVSRRDLGAAVAGALTGTAGIRSLSYLPGMRVHPLSNDKDGLYGVIRQHPDRVTRGWEAGNADIIAKNKDEQDRLVITGYTIRGPNGNHYTHPYWWPKITLGANSSMSIQYDWLPTKNAPLGKYTGIVTIATCTADALTGTPEKDKAAFAQYRTTDTFRVVQQLLSSSATDQVSHFTDSNTFAGGIGSLISAAASLLGPTAHGFFEGFTQAIESFIKNLSKFYNNPIEYVQTMIDGMWKLLTNIQRLAQNLIDVLIKQFTQQMNEANPHEKGTDPYDSFNYGFVGGFAIFKLAKFYVSGGVSQLRQLFTKIRKFRNLIDDMKSSPSIMAAGAKLHSVITRKVARDLSDLSFIADDAESLDEIRESLPDSTRKLLDEVIPAIESDEFRDWLHGRDITQEHLGLAIYFEKLSDTDYRLVRDLPGADLETGDFVRLSQIDVLDSTGEKVGEFDELVVRIDSTDGDVPETTVHRVGEVKTTDDGPKKAVKQLNRALEKAQDDAYTIDAKGIDASSFPDNMDAVVRRVVGPTNAGYEDGKYIEKAKMRNLGYSSTDFNRVKQMDDKTDGQLLKPVDKQR